MKVKCGDIPLSDEVSEHLSSENHCEPFIKNNADVSNPVSILSMSMSTTIVRDQVNEPFQPMNVMYLLTIIILSKANRSFKPEWYKKWLWCHWNSKSERVISKLKSFEVKGYN